MFRVIFSALVYSAERAESVALHTSEFIWLLLSSGTSSMNSLPLEGVHAYVISLPPPCLTHLSRCFDSEQDLNSSLLSEEPVQPSSDSSVHTPL